ncbi:hypothetical protein RND71_033629 [Anisodus tanguticus]|uniref:Uncharacterized protein n=1 Tax=Anisodus tanguticus TaxID=243964 RepID=A0AAE1V451_9SOLA|nr:hypothetical protein RND71_033629 [Anisodus tanguticus]
MPEKEVEHALRLVQYETGSKFPSQPCRAEACLSFFPEIQKLVTAYMPHLSLIYGDLTDEEKKKAQEKDESISSLSFLISHLANHGKQSRSTLFSPNYDAES